MTTWFVVEGEDIGDCTTTHERLSQLCFGNTTRRCHAAFHIRRRNARGSCNSFLNGIDAGQYRSVAES
jgi:hypothetical protein